MRPRRAPRTAQAQRSAARECRPKPRAAVRPGRLAVCVAVAVCCLGTASASGAAPPPPDTCSTAELCVNTVVAGPGAFEAGFATTTVYVAPGSSVTFANGDFVGHQIVSQAVDGLGSPIFSSPLTGSGSTSAVQGVSSLAPGTYSFYCSIHPSTMTGTLVVEAPGPAL